jgi:SAM-dependent methyltransferase
VPDLRAVDLERVLAVHAGRRPEGRRLNIGCGTDLRPGFVNVDVAPLPGLAATASLGTGSLPFADETFSVVLCRDVLEHVDVVPALAEVHRVLTPGGVVVISAVHFTSRNLFVDPTHVRGYSVRTFDFFARGSKSWHRPYYFDFLFSAVEEVKIQFSTLLGHGRFLVWDRVIEPVVNSKPVVQDVYEMTFLSRVFPAANVVAVLRK